MNELALRDQEPRPPRSRADREAANRQNGQPLILLMGIALAVGVLLSTAFQGREERTSEEFMTEVEFYQRQLDIERAEFNGYRAGVNESRGH